MRSRLSAVIGRRAVVALWAVAGLVVVILTYWLLFARPVETGSEEFPVLKSGDVVLAPSGHAYRYVAAPNVSWDRARAAAEKMRFRGKRGYLATVDDAAEFEFVMTRVFVNDTDVTYLGGRQTAPGEWRWVTGPDAAADGGKGTLFWSGYENGHAPEGRFVTWMFSAFQHGGKWDVSKVCCVTLFAYRRRMFSTSLGNGDPDEGVAGYLVEFGN
jgi:hypothetical protein